MLKRILSVVLLIWIMMTPCYAFASSLSNEPDGLAPQAPPIEIVYIDRYIPVEVEVDNSYKVPVLTEFTDENIDTYSLEELQCLIAKQENIQNAAHELAELARELGWPEDCDAIQQAKVEWYNAELIIKIYRQVYDAKYQKMEIAKWAQREEEYPIATEIWQYMKELGWSDYVCAGIMGNLMTEVGGGTLNIQYWLYSSGNQYYGMCQWSKGYSKVWGTDLNTQCNFLRDTIKYELDTYGYAYKTGFNFNSFLMLKDERAAALAFAKCYERCSSAGYTARQNNATEAYNYFVG